MTRKKWIMVLSLVVLIALCGVGATLAFGTTSIERINKVEVGNVHISTDLVTNNVFARASTTPRTLVPGVTVANYKIHITNDGAYPAYIRLKVVPPDNLDLTQIDFKFDEYAGKREGDYFYLKKVLEKGASVNVDSDIRLDEEVSIHHDGKTNTITLNGSPFDPKKQLDYKIEIQALQTDHIDEDASGYPKWPTDAEIKEFAK